MRERLERFMIGRYGNDQLNRFLLCVILVLIALSFFLRIRLFSALEVACLFLCYYRMFSRNIQQRYQENIKFLNMTAPLRSWFGKEKRMMEQRKDFHIYTCPQCKQKIRIPRGKGKIEVTCPKCKNRFIKKS